MAQSVSRINVQVGANVSHLNTGMQQAAASVQSFASSSGNAQFAVQQLVYGVDDAIASFGTGGFSGALRGAQNNITAFAASMFGIKGLMIAVAGVAAVQLGKSLLNIKDNAEQAAAGVKTATDRIREFNDTVDRSRELSDIVGQTRRASFLSSDDRTSGIASTETEILKLQKDIDDTTSKLENMRRIAEEAISQPADVNELRRRFQFQQQNPGQLDPGLPEEYLSQQKAIRELSAELEHLRQKREELITQHDQYVKAERAVAAPEAPSAIGQPFGLFNAGAAAQNLASRLKAARAASRFDPFSAFGRLPNANAFGSSGAVSAVSQAQVGGQNVEDAQLREMRGAHRELRDISRNIGKKLHSLVEVPL